MTDLLNQSALDNLIKIAVAEALRVWEVAQAKVADDRLGYTEAEAASLIGVPQHVLRDARLRGEVNARKVGKRCVYLRTELIRFLTARNG